MIDKQWITAGNAVFTMEVPASFASEHGCRDHYTFKVRFKKGDGDRYWDTFFVSLLTGPDNTSDYSYLGILDKETGAVRLTRASKEREDSWPYRLLSRALARIWQGEGEAVEAAGFKFYHEGKCCRCGRRLTVPESIESGIGPECAQIMAGESR